MVNEFPFYSLIPFAELPFTIAVLIGCCVLLLFVAVLPLLDSNVTVTVLIGFCEISDFVMTLSLSQNSIMPVLVFWGMSLALTGGRW